MNNIPTSVLSLIAYILLAPLVGGLLSGIDRKVSARLQGRYGPPILQPFYDVFKLFQKETLSVNRFQNVYIIGFLLFIIITGAIFFAGGDLLLFVFALTLAGIFLVLAAYSANSPFSFIGAERELLQMLSYEPMVILAAVGFYMVEKSFTVSDIMKNGGLPIIFLPGMFLGFLFILTIKFRKSPFDLSISHHAHQELVKGATTEFSGTSLALIEVAHWYENVFLLGFIFLFFAGNPIVGVAVAIASFFLETFIDNNYARVKWQWAMKTSWLVAITFGFANLVFLYILYILQYPNFLH